MPTPDPAVVPPPFPDITVKGDVLPWLIEAAHDWQQDVSRPSAHYLLLFQGAANEIHRLRAGVRAGAPAWQPIDSAPKDGTEVLLTDGHYKRTGYWASRAHVWSMDAVVSLAMPTHWAPLPTAPARPSEQSEIKPANKATQGDTP